MGSLEAKSTSPHNFSAKGLREIRRVLEKNWASGSGAWANDGVLQTVAIRR